MSLKAIEMQIAIPRTYDAGKLHEQQEQKSQMINYHAAESQVQAEQRKRTSVNKGEPSTNVKQKKEDPKEKNDKNQKKIKNQSNNSPTKSNTHPYKGSFIDFSG